MAKKQCHCDPEDPEDDHKGDYWDNVAFDPEHRLVLAVVPGARTIENIETVVDEVKQRVDAEKPLLLSSDEYPAYASAIKQTFGVPLAAPPGPGRPRIVPERKLPGHIVYATVHKHRQKQRVVGVERRLVSGTPSTLAAALHRSAVSTAINTSFVERHNAADRGRNARKVRKTSRFSKDWQVHESMTYLTMYGYNFCWAVRTLRSKVEQGRWQQRSPAMAAGLTDHVWTWKEWFTRPIVQPT